MKKGRYKAGDLVAYSFFDGTETIRGFGKIIRFFYLNDFPYLVEDHRSKKIYNLKKSELKKVEKIPS